MIEQQQLKVAVLYQAIQAPLIDGIRKPMKPGGYSDSGADIAFNLQRMNIDVITPLSNPKVDNALDWVFADTQEGIDAAISRGANILWANTILFKGHPLESYHAAHHLKIVGQMTSDVERFDNKWLTNELLRQRGLTVAPACLIAHETNLKQKCLAVASITQILLNSFHLQFPLVVKPVRGRGSQGVQVVENLAALKAYATDLLSQTESVAGERYTKYGQSLILEQYEPGMEITITVMPPGLYQDVDKQTIEKKDYWSLPVVKRFNHEHGIAPYNGVVAVVKNSALLSSEEKRDSRYALVQAECEQAARVIGARAPIRIDCREGKDHKFYLFDLNMKPNMTGPGRNGRDDQDNLSAIAAKGEPLHWDYPLLLLNMLKQAWPAKDMGRTAMESIV